MLLRWSWKTGIEIGPPGRPTTRTSCLTPGSNLKPTPWSGTAQVRHRNREDEGYGHHRDWHVISSPDFDDDYLYMETTPTSRSARRSAGERRFHIGLIVGSLAGRMDEGRALFSFEATDEMEPVNGAGTIALQDGRLILTLLFHFGDEFTFECELV